MWSANQKLAYLKVIAALAWADGEFSAQELNYIKNLALKFSLPDRAWAELEPCLYDAVTPDESRLMLENFLHSIGSEKDKQDLINDLKGMANVDNQITPQEQAFLQDAARLLGNTSSLKLLTGSFKRLFTTVTTPADNLADFLRNKILYKLKRRIEQGKLPKIEEGRLKYLALFGGLLGQVAYADNDFSEDEVNYLKKQLTKLADFSEQEAGLTALVIQEATLMGVDNAAMVTDFLHLSNEEQRQQLVDCLFCLSLADGKMSIEEIEEIRKIATALGFSHKAFIDSKLRAKNQA